MTSKELEQKLKDLEKSVQACQKELLALKETEAAAAEPKKPILNAKDLELLETSDYVCLKFKKGRSPNLLVIDRKDRKVTLRACVNPSFGMELGKHGYVIIHKE